MTHTAGGSARPRAFPRAVPWFIATLGGAGAASVIASVRAFGSPSHIRWIDVAMFATTTTVSALLILRVHYRKQVMALDLFEAGLAPAIFALPAPVVVAIAALAQLVANLIRRNARTKTAFNVAQWSAAAGAGALVFGHARAGAGATSTNVIAVLLALGAVAAVNAIAFPVVIRLAEGQRILPLVPAMAPNISLGFAFNATIGLLFVIAYAQTPASVPLFLVPLGALAWSYRGYAAAMADRARLGRMHEATRVLSKPVDPMDAFPAFVAEVRTCFAADAVELAVLRDGGRIVYRADASGSSSRLELGDSTTLAGVLMGSARTRRVQLRDRAIDERARAALEREGWSDAVCSPVREGDETLGVLCVYDPSGPEGWEEGELHVLDALAREAAAALRKAEMLGQIIGERAKLRQVVERTSDGILAFDPSGAIVVWNPAMESITGWKADDVLGTRAFGSLSARTEDGYSVAIDPRADLPSTIEITTRNGETRVLACSHSRVLDAEDRLTLSIVIARDVTAARETERLKDDFVATVSHELRTPLTPIIGWAETLQNHGESMTSDQRDEAVRSIKRQAQHLERLIVNLLEVSKIERGHIGAHRQPVEPEPIVESIVDQFRATEPHRTFLVRATGRGFAEGDPLLTGQIVSNLLSNAVKYSPAHEPIEILIRRHNGLVSIGVADRGPGIPVSEQEHIFERFRRLGDPLRRAQGGAGLGLFIARRLAAVQGGSVDVVSAPGKGSTFTLHLPQAGAMARAN